MAFNGSWNESYPESRCAPTIEGNKVYVTSGSGDLASFDANKGKLYIRHGKVLMAYNIKNK